MGEKGNGGEVLQQLRAMAEQKDPSVRDQMMKLLSEYQTVTGVLGGRKGGEEEPGAGTSEPPPAV